MSLFSKLTNNNSYRTKSWSPWQAKIYDKAYDDTEPGFMEDRKRWKFSIFFISGWLWMLAYIAQTQRFFH